MTSSTELVWSGREECCHLHCYYRLGLVPSAPASFSERLLGLMLLPCHNISGTDLEPQRD